MAFRAVIPDFQIANRLYAAAVVTFYLADEDGESTEELAILYRAPTGPQTVSNPQTLDAFGKFFAPVYTEAPVVAEVSSGTVGTHSTGAIAARGRWRGNWVTGTRYFVNDTVVDPVGGSIYQSTNDHVAGASIAADVTAGNLVISFDASAAQASAAAAIAAAVDAAVAAAVAAAEAAVFTAGLAPARIGSEAIWPGVYPPDGWLFEFAQAVSRTTYEDLMEVLTDTATVSRVGGNATLTSVSKDLRGLGLLGAAIEGTGIPPGTTIIGIAETTITLSATVTGTGSMDVRIFPYGNGDGSTTFNLPEGRIFPFGRDDMGGTAAGRISFAESGVHGDRLGKVGGAQQRQLAQANLPNVNLTGTAASAGGHTHNWFTSASIGGASGGGPVAAPQNSGVAWNTSTNGAHEHSVTTPLGGSDTPFGIVPPAGARNIIIFTGVV